MSARCLCLFAPFLCSLIVSVYWATRLVLARLSLIRTGYVQEPVRTSRAAEIMRECVFQMIPKSIPNRYHFDWGVRPNRPKALSVPSRTEANRTCASSRRITVSVLSHTEELGIVKAMSQSERLSKVTYLLVCSFPPYSKSVTPLHHGDAYR